MLRVSLSRYIVYAIAIVVALSTFSGVFRLPTYYYIGATTFIFVISVITKSKDLNLGSRSIMTFVLICVLSILVNQPASYFRVWERLALFVNTLLAFSPLIACKGLQLNRIYLFDILVKIMMLFAVASFVGYFFGINFFVRNGDVLAYNEAGHFSGFANHSMVLAPISAMGGIYALTKALARAREKNKLVWWSVALLCFGAVLLSASRGSLGGIVLAIVVTIYRFNLGKTGKFLRYAVIGVAIVAVSFPLWGGLTQYVIEKNESNLSQGGFIYSRETKMAARIYEIQHNFISGVGFSVIDEAVDSVDRTTGTIEPNSSWLGVFSMTGVFGFIVFLLIYVQAFKTAFTKIPDKNIATLLCGILAFFLVHMIIEGYVLAGGNFLCGTYWLTLGVVYAYSSLNNKPALK